MRFTLFIPTNKSGIMTTIGDAVASVDRVERKGDDKLLIFGKDAMGDGVVGKTTVDDAGDSLIAYEAAVYNQVINPMMAEEQCANLVTSVAWLPTQPIVQYYFDVFDAIRASTSNDKEADVAELRDYKNAVQAEAGDGGAVKGDGEAVSTLVTLVPPKFVGSVWDMFDTLRDDWRVPFQMAYTLSACELNGLSHNDNHLSNWLVSLGMPVVHYAVSASQFVAVGGLRLWLYDWDLGYAEALGPNPGLGGERCRQLGMCNAVSGLHDLAQMACSLDWFAPGFECSQGSSEYMWERLRRVVCARSADYEEEAGICHIDVESLSWPAGASNAIEYVLQLPDVAAQVIDVATMDRGTAGQLLNGELPWVAHAGIDRDALMASLRNRVAQSRKRPRGASESVALEPAGAPSESVSISDAVEGPEGSEEMTIQTTLPWASQGAPKISRVGV